jgi:multiple sugar transport system substrate-binding protein
MTRLLHSTSLGIISGLAFGSVMMAGAPAMAEQITLNWALWDWSKAPYYQPVIDAYQAKHPDVKITYTDLGSQDYQTVLQTQLTGGGSDLDIITVKDVPGYANLIRSKLLENVSSAVSDPKPYGGLIEALTVDGGLYAVPFRSDFWVLYYNKDIFDKAGIAHPTNDMTLDQWAELAQKLTSGFGSNKVYGSLLHTWRSTVELPAILDGKHTLVDGGYDFLKPYYERALKLQSDGAVPSYASLKTTKTHYSGPFFNSTVAMLPMGSWFIGTQIAKVKSGESKSVNWGLVKYPHPDGVAPGTTASTVTSLGVSANSKHKEAALDFVKFATGPEGAAILADTGTIPALRDDTVINKISSTDGFPSDPGSKEALKTVQTYLEMPVNLKAAEIEVVLNRAHDAIMTDNVSVDDGLKEMDAGVKPILGN